MITKPADLTKNKEILKVSEEDDDEMYPGGTVTTKTIETTPTIEAKPEANENIDKEQYYLKRNEENEARIAEILKQNQELRTKMSEMTTSFDEKEEKIKELSQHKRFAFFFLTIFIKFDFN